MYIFLGQNNKKKTAVEIHFNWKIALTHNGNLDWIRNLIALNIGCLTSVATSLFSGHLLQDQTLVRDNDPAAEIVHHFFALKQIRFFCLTGSKLKGLRGYIVPPSKFIRRGIGVNGA